MPTNPTIESPTIEETAITLFCWWEALAVSPKIVRTIFGHAVPSAVKAYLLSWQSNPNFWVMCPLALLSFPLVFKFLSRHRTAPPRLDKDDGIIVVSNETERRRGRIYLIRFARSLGLLWLREKWLDWQKVLIYGTFNRPSEWPEAPDRASKVDRIRFVDGPSVEYQYSAAYDVLIVRRTPHRSDAYGPATRRKPLAKDVKLMMVASTYFPYWYFRYLLRRLKQVLGFR